MSVSETITTVIYEIQIAQMDKQADKNMRGTLCLSVKKGEERMSILPLPMEFAVIFTSQAGIENNKKT